MTSGDEVEDAIQRLVDDITGLRFVHGDRRVCEHRDGTWTVRENPANRGVVGLDCDRHWR